MEKIYSGIINYARGPETDLFTAACLDETEAQRYDRLRLPLVKASFLAGRALIRGMLAQGLGIDRDSIAIELAPGGKPYLRGRPDIHCSISHSHHLAAAAWGNRMMGIDIEYQRPGRDIAGIAQNFYGTKEQKLIANAGIAASRFFHICWCLKESWLKLCGDGMAGFATVPQFLPAADGSLTVILSPDLSNPGLLGVAGFRFQARELLSPSGDRYFWALAHSTEFDAPAPEIVESQAFPMAGDQTIAVWESGFVANPGQTRD